MIPAYPGYEAGVPYVDGSAYLEHPLFWPGHLTSSLLAEEAQRLAWGPDWDAGMELGRELLAPDRWPVFTVPVGDGCSIHVVYRNFEGDSGTDYLFSHPEWANAELLASDEGHFMGPGLSWRELDTAAPDDETLLLLFPMLGDTDVSVRSGRTRRVGAGRIDLDRGAGAGRGVDAGSPGSVGPGFVAIT